MWWTWRTLSSPSLPLAPAPPPTSSSPSLPYCLTWEESKASVRTNVSCTTCTSAWPNALSASVCLKTKMERWKGGPAEKTRRESKRREREVRGTTNKKKGLESGCASRNIQDLFVHVFLLKYLGLKGTVCYEVIGQQSSKLNYGFQVLKKYSLYTIEWILVFPEKWCWRQKAEEKCAARKCQLCTENNFNFFCSAFRIIYIGPIIVYSY